MRNSFHLRSSTKNIGNWQRATLYVEDPLEEEKIILGTGSVNQHGEEEKVVISLSFKGRKKSSRIFMQDVVRCLFYMKIMNSRRYVHLVGNIKFLNKNTTRKKEDIDLLLIQKMIFCILLR